MARESEELLFQLWWGEIYDKVVTETGDVEFLLALLERKGKDLRILEPCCGTGRIAIPLARAGHRVHGFDQDEGMLARLPAKAEGLPNLSWGKKNALAEPWGTGYDAVILGGNALINIELAEHYQEAQQAFLRRAAEALAPGGHLFLDLDIHRDPAAIYGDPGWENKLMYQGTDSRGNHGTVRFTTHSYDPGTRICSNGRRMELALAGGPTIVRQTQSNKYIPTQAQVERWLGEAGLAVEGLWWDYQDPPHLTSAHRATYWAVKPRGVTPRTEVK